MTRRLILTASALALIGLSASTLPFAPRLIWNASASVPIGLYALRPVDAQQLGDLLAVEPPPEIAGFIAERGYTAPDVPLLKHVAAVAGQRVCRRGIRITVDARPVGAAQLTDRLGRPMPRWRGCTTVADGWLFLMNADVPDSLDGRYFGPLSADTVLGRAVPIWLREAASAPHIGLRPSAQGAVPSLTISPSLTSQTGDRP